MSDAAITMDEVRRARLTRQGLRGGFSPLTLAEGVTALLGVPMPVGASAALALRARGLIERREELDEAWLQRGELAAVPGPRGMVWLCAAADAPLLRSFAVADHAAREARVASAAALTAGDLINARDALRAALSKPLRPEELRERLAPELTRPLGAQVQRAGAVTLAGLVLRGMWCVGEVTRAPVSGRVDGEVFAYSIDGYPRVTPNAAEAVDVVARRWFAAQGPASARAFAAAFGIAAGRAAAALKPLRLKAIRSEFSDDTLLVAGDVGTPPWRSPEVALVGVRDPLTDASPTLAGFVAPERARGAIVRQLGPSPLVLVDGEVQGTWGVDGQGHVVLRLFGALSDDVDEAVRGAAETLQWFIRDSLGARPALHGTTLPRQLPPITAEIGGGL